MNDLLMETGLLKLHPAVADSNVKSNGSGARPVALLFLFATLAVDLLLAILDIDSFLTAGACVAQLSAALMFMVRDPAHRLLRAGTVVAVVAIVKTLSQTESYDNFSYLMVFAGVQLTLLMTCEAVLKIGALSRYGLRLRPLRFPLVELFGWTIVVAVGAALLSTARHVDLSDRQMMELVLLAVGPTMAYVALALKGSRFFVGVLMGVSGSLLAAYWMTTPYPALFRPIAWLTVGQVGYVLAWLAVVRLDQPTSGGFSATGLND